MAENEKHFQLNQIIYKLQFDYNSQIYDKPREYQRAYYW